VDVCPVELPGRGTRYGEPLATDMSSIRATMLESMAPLLDLPVALFGHSMGAEIAFELCRALGALGKDVKHLFVSAARAPTLPQIRPLANLPRDEFVDELRALGGVPEAVLADREMMDLLLPVVRADLALHEAYRLPEAVPAPCPITAFGATADVRVPLEQARAWEAFSGGAFRFITIEGGHFFLTSAADVVFREIMSDLAALGDERR
jgi:medium-chain acyl-[acyl-carrier-protein] hydrolase